MQIVVEVSGLAEAEARFAEAPAFIESQMERTMDLALARAQGDVQALTPVLTGTLRRSIHGQVFNAGRLGKLGTNLIYARFIETGKRLGRTGKTVYRRAGPARMFEQGIARAVPTIERLYQDMARRIAERLG